MVYDGYVKYEEAEIHRSAIMHDFQDIYKKKNIKKKNSNIKKKIKMAAILDFLV